MTKLCETRFVEKHKSIRQFYDQYIIIVEGLEEISKSSHFNNKTKQRSYELLIAITTPIFLILLSIMAIYSSKFEVISTVLQITDINLKQTTIHIQDLLIILENHRKESETEFSKICKKCKEK